VFVTESAFPDTGGMTIGAIGAIGARMGSGRSPKGPISFC
jgi:hypothetical protein